MSARLRVHVEGQDVSNHSAAFDLLDQAIAALFTATRDDDNTPHDVPVDAVLLVGVQRVDDEGDRIGYVEVYPRAGSQPAYITRGLIDEGRKLLDQISDNASDD